MQHLAENKIKLSFLIDNKADREGLKTSHEAIPKFVIDIWKDLQTRAEIVPAILQECAMQRLFAAFAFI